MAYASDLSGSKLKAKLSSTLNEAAASTSHLQPTSSFAARHMQKLGWTEGTGLGKQNKGMVSHLKVYKRDDEQKLGLGCERGESHHPSTSSHTHTHHAPHQSLLGETLMKLQKRRMSSEDKKEDDSDKKKKKEQKRRKEEKREKKKAKELEKDEGDDDGKKKEKKKRKRNKEDEITTTTTTTVKIYTDEELFHATGGARFGMRAQRRAHGKWQRTESGEILAKMEEEAKMKVEWNGLGPARVLLSKDEKKTKIKKER